jgi:hypothetical protein
LFFPKLFFHRDFLPPQLHGRTVMDYNKDARTTTNIPKDTRATIISDLSPHHGDEEEQESRTTLPQGGGDDAGWLSDTTASRPSSAAPPIVDATPWSRSPTSGPTTQTPAIYVKVNSFLSTLDLVNTLDGMLPHVGVLHVIRYKSHRGTGGKELPWCKEEGRRRRKEEKEEEGGGGPAGPESGPTGPQTDLPGWRPDDRPHNRTARSQARSDRPQTGSDENYPPNCLSYPLMYLFAMCCLVGLYIDPRHPPYPFRQDDSLNMKMSFVSLGFHPLCIKATYVG